MQRPGWVAAVGIIGIVFGCLGILGSGQSLMFPTIIGFQKKMFAEMRQNTKMRMQDVISRAHANRTGTPCPDFSKGPDPTMMFGVIEKMYDTPDWFTPWCIISGSVGMLLSGFYVFASTWFFLMKKRSVALFFWASGAGIAYSITKVVVAFFASSFIGLSMMVWGVMWVVVAVVMVVVVASSDRGVFGQAQD